MARGARPRDGGAPSRKTPNRSKGPNRSNGAKGPPRNRNAKPGMKPGMKGRIENNGQKRKKNYYSELAKQAKVRGLTLTSAPSPALTLQRAMEGISIVKDLMDGIPVIKISSQGDFQKRVVTLSHDRCTLFITHGKVSDKIDVSRLPTPIWTPTKGYKGEYQRYIDVADILEVQAGVVGTHLLERMWGTLKKKKNEIKNNLVVIHHAQYMGRTTLHLVIENPKHRMSLIGALETIRQTYEEQEQWVGREILLLRYIWYDVDADKNSMISEKEFLTILGRINFYVPDASKRFREFVRTHKAKNKELTYKQTTDLIHSLTKTHAVDEVWKKVFGGGPSVTAKIFHEKFLRKVQGETEASLQDAKDLIASVNSLELAEGSEPVNSLKLDKKRFAELLRSEWNDAYDPVLQQAPKERLSKPLCHYWINTSHNTYLTGDQLTSLSSVEAYTTALQKGCKCIEIDCWDGDDFKGEYVPMVCHGKNRTSRIELRSVLFVIDNYLRSNPQTYPIILSLENHCSQPYQEEMAHMFKLLFGKRLFIPNTAQRKSKMPSPEKLRGMLIIKAKRPPDHDDEEHEDRKKKTKRDDDPYANLFDQFDLDAKPPESKRPSTFAPKSTNNVEDTVPEDGEVGTSKYARELLELVYFHGTKFKVFEESISLMASHMHSIGESRIVKLVTQYDNNPDLWREYNSGHVTRIYPAPSRTNSSNYNPVLAWAMGCQMVALNFQTSDTNMILNHGRFRQAGNCGYVEKPKSVLGECDRPLPRNIKIRVVAGSCLPKPRGEKEGARIDPMVKIELHDVQVTKRGKEQYYTDLHETKCVDDNGYSPVWRDSGKEFVVKNDDVAMFVFHIVDSDVVGYDMIASAAIPVYALRKGFRSIQLYDERNTRLGPYHYATLLVHILYA